MSTLTLALLMSFVLLSRCDDLNEATKDESLIVQTSKGLIKGMTVLSLDKEVDVFYGIPYAKPPVGELRFRHPKPADPWTGTLDATKLPNACVQANLTIPEGFEMLEALSVNSPLSEDCLTLTVWVPKPRPKDAAVMLWIHGGGFISGSPNIAAYEPRVLCSEERVIVVSIAYRVASLGFLYLDKADVPGNVGLLDQRLAFEWVHDNIEHFGGDPKKVTLIGQSAGGVSVGLHLLSHLSHELFARGIVISGSFPTPWLVMDPIENAENGLRFAESLQCPHDPKDMDAIVDCLRTKDPVDMVLAETEMFGIMKYPFQPIVDGYFLTEPVEAALAAKSFKKTELLIGATSEDGTMISALYLPEYFNLTNEVALTRQQFMNSVKKAQPLLGEMVHEAIFFEYTDWNDPENTTTYRDAVGNFFSDICFVCPAKRFASIYAEAGNDVYMYIFSHIPSVNTLPSWMGSVHCHDIPFFFGQVLNPELGFSEDEKQFSRTMMRYWANFARTGNPNKGPEESFEPISWPLHMTADRHYLNLNAKSTEVGKNVEARKCAFWQEYVPMLLQRASKSNPEYIRDEQVKEESFSMVLVMEMVLAVAMGIFIFLRLW